MRAPKRALGTMYGTLDIDSKPPATTTSARPSWICCAPSTMAFMPLLHTLLMVVHWVESGSPA